MINNHVYNLMIQIVQESKTLDRIDAFVADAGDCGECKAFWEKMRIDKEGHVRELEDMIRKHL